MAKTIKDFTITWIERKAEDAAVADCTCIAYYDSFTDEIVFTNSEIQSHRDYQPCFKLENGEVVGFVP